MDTLSLEAEVRKPEQKPKELRRGGLVPAVYYGRGISPRSLHLNSYAFQKVYSKAGENTIIELKVEGAKFPVLVHDVQYDPVTDKISHVDFLHIDMEKEVTTSVKVSMIGTAPAVKNLGGILDIQKHEIKIRCLPKDLIHSIEVDVSGIEDFHTSVHVKDLKVPPTIKILDKPDDTVVTAVPPRKEEEEVKPAVAEAAPAEGAVAAEGAAAGAPAASPAPQAAAAGKEGKK